MLQRSELRAFAGRNDYREWHAVDPSARPLRAKALSMLRIFEDEYRWVASRHDLINDQRAMMLAEPVFDIIDQHGTTQLGTIDDARRAVNEYITLCLQTVSAAYDQLDGQVLVVPDTNVLIDFPELGRYHLRLPMTTVVFTPTVIKELEDHKRRLPKNAKDLQDVSRWMNAKAVIRTLKQCGDVGNILRGVRLTDRVSVMALASEPKRENLPVYDGISIALPTTLPPEPKRMGFPDWLDLDVPDDRFIASALEVRREHPKAKILVLSGDFNVLTKARQAQVPAFDAEAFFEETS